MELLLESGKIANYRKRSKPLVLLTFRWLVYGSVPCPDDVDLSHAMGAARDRSATGYPPPPI